MEAVEKAARFAYVPNGSFGMFCGAGSPRNTTLHLFNIRSNLELQDLVLLVVRQPIDRESRPLPYCDKSYVPLPDNMEATRDIVTMSPARPCAGTYSCRFGLQSAYQEQQQGQSRICA